MASDDMRCLLDVINDPDALREFLVDPNNSTNGQATVDVAPTSTVSTNGSMHGVAPAPSGAEWAQLSGSSVVQSQLAASTPSPSSAAFQQQQHLLSIPSSSAPATAPASQVAQMVVGVATSDKMALAAPVAQSCPQAPTQATPAVATLSSLPCAAPSPLPAVVVQASSAANTQTTSATHLLTQLSMTSGATSVVPQQQQQLVAATTSPSAVQLQQANLQTTEAAPIQVHNAAFTPQYLQPQTQNLVSMQQTVQQNVAAMLSAGGTQQVGSVAHPATPTNMIQRVVQLSGQPTAQNQPPSQPQAQGLVLQGQPRLTQQPGIVQLRRGVVQLQGAATTTYQQQQQGVIQAANVVNLNQLKTVTNAVHIRPQGSIANVVQGTPAVQLQGVAPATSAAQGVQFQGLQHFQNTQIQGVASSGIQGIVASTQGIQLQAVTSAATTVQFQSIQSSGVAQGQQLNLQGTRFFIQGNQVVAAAPGQPSQQVNLGNVQCLQGLHQVQLRPSTQGAQTQSSTVGTGQLQLPTSTGLAVQGTKVISGAVPQILKLVVAPNGSQTGKIAIQPAPQAAHLPKLAPAVASHVVTTPTTSIQQILAQNQPQAANTVIGQAQSQLLNLLPQGLTPQQPTGTGQQVPPVQNVTFNINGDTINIGSQNFNQLQLQQQPQQQIAGINLEQIKGLPGVGQPIQLMAPAVGQGQPLTAEQLQQNPQLQQQLLQSLNLTKQQGQQTVQVPGLASVPLSANANLQQQQQVVGSIQQPLVSSSTATTEQSNLQQVSQAVPAPVAVAQQPQQCISNPSPNPASMPVSHSVSPQLIHHIPASAPAATATARPQAMVRPTQKPARSPSHSSLPSPLSELPNKRPSFHCSLSPEDVGTVPPQGTVPVAAAADCTPMTIPPNINSQTLGLSTKLPFMTSAVGSVSTAASPKVTPLPAPLQQALQSISKQQGSQSLVPAPHVPPSMSISEPLPGISTAAPPNITVSGSPSGGTVIPTTGMGTQTPPQQMAQHSTIETIQLSPKEQQQLQILQQQIKHLLSLKERTPQQQQQLKVLGDQQKELLHAGKLQAMQSQKFRQQQEGVLGSPPRAVATAQVPKLAAIQQQQQQQQQQQIRKISVEQPRSSISAPVVPVQPLLTTTACSVVYTTTGAHSAGTMVTSTSTPVAGVLPPPHVDIAQQPPVASISSTSNSLVSTSQLPTITSLSQLPKPLRERLEGQLAKMAPDQQQLFYKNQTAVLLRLQQQLHHQIMLQQQSVANSLGVSSEQHGSSTGQQQVTIMNGQQQLPQQQQQQQQLGSLPLTVEQANKHLTETKKVGVGPATTLHPSQLPSVLVSAAAKTGNSLDLATLAKTNRLKPTYLVTKKQLIMAQLTRDHMGALKPDYTSPFKDRKDATKRLLRYHVLQTREPTPKEMKTADDAYEELAQDCLDQANSMMCKFRKQLFMDSMREVVSSEVVMLERKFLDAEKEQLEEDRRMAREEPDKFVPMPVGMCPSPTDSEPSTPTTRQRSTSTDDDFDSRAAMVNSPASSLEEKPAVMGVKSEGTEVASYISKQGSGLKLLLKSSPNHVRSPVHIPDCSFQPFNDEASVPVIKQELEFGSIVKKPKLENNTDVHSLGQGASDSHQFEAFLDSKNFKMEGIDETPTISPPGVPFKAYGDSQDADASFDDYKSEADAAVANLLSSTADSVEDGADSVTCLDDSFNSEADAERTYDQEPRTELESAVSGLMADMGEVAHDRNSHLNGTFGQSELSPGSVDSGDSVADSIPEEPQQGAEGGPEGLTEEMQSTINSILSLQGDSMADLDLPDTDRLVYDSLPRTGNKGSPSSALLSDCDHDATDHNLSQEDQADLDAAVQSILT